MNRSHRLICHICYMYNWLIRNILNQQRSTYYWALMYTLLFYKVGCNQENRDDSSTANDSSTVTAFNATITDKSLIDQLRNFWELEEVESKAIVSPIDQCCEDHFQSTHQRAPDGRYIVRLPLKTSVDLLNFGNSRDYAVIGLRRMENRFIRDTSLKQQYCDFLCEYESLGHMRRAERPSNLSSTYYIPHHCVLKKTSSSTKLRVVFDASCRTSAGSSLNDHLYTGQKLQQDLSSIIMRWRMHSIVVITDIEKMFRQIMVHQDDVDLQRIV